MRDFEAAVARIEVHVPGRPGTVGAGFLVRPDLLVTCDHVVADATDSVQVRFPQAPGTPPSIDGRVLPPDPVRAAGRPDVAFIHLSEPVPGAKVLDLRAAPGAEGSLVRAFGFPAQAPPCGHPGTARVGRIFLDEGLAVLGLTDANALAQGFSGSPIVDGDGLVVGMITAHPGADPYGRGEHVAYAVPSSVIQEAGPGLQAHLECPYPGLRPFTCEQARWYHGRSQAVTTLTDRLHAHRGVLALLGPSGSGKSSLVGAGLLPALDRGAVPELDPQAVQVLRPDSNPHVAFAALTQDVLTQAGEQAAGGRRGLVVIDQFEELLTAKQVLATLTDLATGDSPLSVLLVLRDDFYPLLGRNAPALLDRLQRKGRMTSLTDRLTVGDLRDIITGPARTQNWNLDPVLVDRLIRDLIDHHTQTAPLTDLPLLALTLRGIWDTATRPQPHPGTGPAMVDNTLTAGDYERGSGIRSAFATWCDKAYLKIPDGDKRAARAVLTALVQDGDPAHGTPTVRRRRTLSELATLTGPGLAGAVSPVVDYLAKERVINVHRDQAIGDAVVELAHDTVIEHWEALREWLDEDRDRRRWLDRTEGRARHWDATGRRHVGLLEDDELTEARRHQDDGPTPDLVSEYIRASDAGQRARARTRRRIQTALAALTVTALAVAGLAYYKNQQATQARDREILARQAAVSRQLAVQAGALLASNPDLGSLLAVQAYRTSPTEEAAGVLATAAAIPVLHRFVGHTDVVTSVAFSPDGAIVASGSKDHTVRLWEAATGRPRATLTGHTDAVTSVAFSPDGTIVASGSRDRTVRLWDPGTARLTRTLTGSTGPVNTITFVPDNGLLVTAGEDSKVRFWNVSTGRLHGAAEGLSSAVTSIQYSRDGRFFAMADTTGSLMIENRQTARSLPTSAGAGAYGTVDSIAFSPGGGLMASAAQGSSGVRLWNTTTGKALDTLIGHTDTVTSVAFSPDGTTLASASSDHTVRTWDVGRRMAILTGHPGRVTSVAFSPDGTALASASGGENTVRLWDVATRRPGVTLTGHTGMVQSVAYSPDGHTLATGGLDHTVRLWDPSTGRSLATLTGAGIVDSVAFSPDGHTLATGSGDGALRVWDLATRRLRATLIGHTGAVTSAAYSPDGSTLASGSFDHTVRLWSLATLRATAVLPGHTNYVMSVAFSPDGHTLVSASLDRTVRLWDPLSGHLRTTLTGHTNGVASVAFSRDGHTLVSAGFDDTVRLWDTRTGKAGGTLTGYENIVPVVTFSPEGHTLATGSWDGSVRVWTMGSTVPTAMDQVCRAAGRDLSAQERATYLPAGSPNTPVCI